MSCGKYDLKYGFTSNTVNIECGKCGLKVEIPSLIYFQKWGYPKGSEKKDPAEWLHEMEREVGRDFMTKVKVTFTDTTNNVNLGVINIQMSAIRKLSVGDVIEFKPPAAIFGKFYIKSFAVNDGIPEGIIYLEPIKVKATINLVEYNREYLDSLLPF